jgi:hypothetical protein
VTDYKNALNRSTRRHSIQITIPSVPDCRIIAQKPQAKRFRMVCTQPFVSVVITALKFKLDDYRGGTQ